MWGRKNSDVLGEGKGIIEENKGETGKGHIYSKRVKMLRWCRQQTNSCGERNGFRGNLSSLFGGEGIKSWLEVGFL